MQAFVRVYMLHCHIVIITFGRGTELVSFHCEVLSGYIMRLHELTFAKLLAQGQLIPLYQDVLQTGQQPATEALQ